LIKFGTVMHVCPFQQSYVADLTYRNTVKYKTGEVMLCLKSSKFRRFYNGNFLKQLLQFVRKIYILRKTSMNTPPDSSFNNHPIFISA